MGTLHVCFLWHMHQPPYASPLRGEVTMPWVRLHSVKDYADMALALEAVPEARATVNWVPSLLDQVEAAQAPDYPPRELFWRLSLARPEDLSPEERQLIARHFFALDHEHMLEPWPRYVELRARARSRPLDDEELRDLQVWFNLAWCGESARDAPEIRALLERGRSFDEADKATVLGRHSAMLAELIPRWRALQDAGQAELCCSPAYHPILPLLADTDLAREADPHTPLPSLPFRWPGDASYHVRRGLASHAARFGRPPSGMWPSEGSVSQPTAELASASGLRWLATDEAILHRALGGVPRSATRRLGPWRTGDLSLFFRDHDLSDRIGFVYASWSPRAAQEDFLRRLQRMSAELDGKDGVVTIALDGENCWETYRGGVMGFLPDLYRTIGATRGLRLSTLSEALDAVGTAGRELETLPAGSWIDGNFRTWLGDPAKNRAWTHLARARAAVGESLDTLETTDPVLADLVARAEASDWFWWLGHGHTSEFDAWFDTLFREHLSAIWRRLGQEPPAELSQPIDPQAARPGLTSTSPPSASFRPPVTGHRGAYYAWCGAGEIRPTFGAIHRAGQAMARARYVGTDEGLGLRIETTGPATDVLADCGLRLEVGGETVTLWPAAPRADGVEVAVGEVLDAWIPAELLGASRPVSFVLQLVDPQGHPLERLPPDERAVAELGDGLLLRSTWSV